MTDAVKPEDRKAIADYLGSLRMDEPASQEEIRKMMRGAIGDRGLMVYLIWKLLQERYPDIDATGLLAEACWQFGEIKGKRFGQVDSPADWMKKLSSRGGILAWDQEIVELNDEKAVKIFRYCPHMEAARSAGATPEEIAQLCRKIMINADYGTISPFPHLEISFPGRTCGEGGQCAMTVTRKQG